MKYILDYVYKIMLYQVNYFSFFKWNKLQPFNMKLIFSQFCIKDLNQFRWLFQSRSTSFLGTTKEGKRIIFYLAMKKLENEFSKNLQFSV